MSNQEGSNEGSQHMFLLRNKKKLSLNYLQYPLLSGVLKHLLYLFGFMTGVYPSKYVGQIEFIIGLRCRPRNPNPSVNGLCRKEVYEFPALSVVPRVWISLSTLETDV